MRSEDYFDFYNRHPHIVHARPDFKFDDYHQDLWKRMDVTAIVCQRKAKNVIQLLLESLYRFYPDILTVVSDDESEDDSTQYLLYKQLTTPNLLVWERTQFNSLGRHGHGTQLHEMIEKFVRTKYCLLLDSDMIIERGGFVEGMIREFERDENLYAIGTLHWGSYKGNGGEPEDEQDALPYPHPQCSMIRVDKYNELNAPFVEDGAPCILNYKAAFDRKWRMDFFPTDKFVSHRGAGNTSKNVWANDHNVMLRPFITFIQDELSYFPIIQTDRDFDVIIATKKEKTVAGVIDHDGDVQIFNNVFNIRFQITGEYVADIRMLTHVNEEFITRAKTQIIEAKAPDEIVVDGITLTKRQLWQKTKALE